MNAGTKQSINQLSAITLQLGFNKTMKLTIGNEAVASLISVKRNVTFVS